MKYVLLTMAETATPLVGCAWRGLHPTPTPTPSTSLTPTPNRKVILIAGDSRCLRTIVQFEMQPSKLLEN